MEFFTSLFDTSDFPARWRCGNWTPAHGWLHILSDLGVWAAYFAIPLVLGYFVARRRDLPFRRVFLLFVAFILLCGTTHLMEAIIFWWPAYRLAGALKLITAVVSWITVLALVRVAPAVLAMRAPEELEREVAARTDAEQQLKEANAELERRVEERTAELGRSVAESERQRRLYETVLTNTPDFVYVFSLDHKVLYANDALIKMWGRGHDGAIGKTFLEIGYEPWHAEMHDREIDQVRATRQPIRGEVPFNGTHGRRQYDYIFVPVIGADGEVEAVAGTTRDVTERKEAEEAVAGGRGAVGFALAAAAAGVGFWYCDLPFDVRSGGTSLVKAHFHLPPDAAVTIQMFYDRRHPDDRAAVDAAFQKSVATGPDALGPWSIASAGRTGPCGTSG